MYYNNFINFTKYNLHYLIQKTIKNITLIDAYINLDLVYISVKVVLKFPPQNATFSDLFLNVKADLTIEAFWNRIALSKFWKINLLLSDKRFLAHHDKFFPFLALPRWEFGLK